MSAKLLDNSVFWTLLGKDGIIGVGDILVMTKDRVLKNINNIDDDELYEMFGKNREEFKDMIAEKILEAQMYDN